MKRYVSLIFILLLGALLWAQAGTAAQTPSRFPNGIVNQDQNDFANMLPILDPTKVYVWFDDFNTYAAGDWVISTTENTDTASEALNDIQFAALVITNATTDNDDDQLQAAKETLKFVSGKQTWFAARIKINESTESDWRIGLMVRDTDFISAVPEGVLFSKDDGDANIDFSVTNDSTATTASAVDTIADDTFIELAFYYDGVSTIHYFTDNSVISTAVTTNLPDTELTVSFGIKNGRAAADYGPSAMTLDYIFVAQER